MAIPVLLILAVLWAAVLVPPVLRSRSESRRGGVGDLHTRLGALNHSRSPARSMGARGARAPLRSVPPLHAARSRAAGRTSRGPRRVPGADEAALPSRAMTPAQKRRRNVLVVLIGGVIVSLGLAVLVNPMLWIAQGIADVLLAVYLYLLVLPASRLTGVPRGRRLLGFGARVAAPPGGAGASPRSGASRAGAAPGSCEAAPVRCGLTARAAATVDDRPVRASSRLPVTALATSSRRSTAPARSRSTRPGARSAACASAIRAVHRREFLAGTRADRGGRRVSRRGGRRDRRPPRRALRRQPPRRQEGVRRGEPHARLRGRSAHPGRRGAARRDARLPERHGGSGERAAAAGARLPAARRARRSREPARGDGRRLHRARSRSTIPRR